MSPRSMFDATVLSSRCFRLRELTLSSRLARGLRLSGKWLRCPTRTPSASLTPVPTSTRLRAPLQRCTSPTTRTRSRRTPRTRRGSASAPRRPTATFAATMPAGASRPRTTRPTSASLSYPTSGFAERGSSTLGATPGRSRSSLRSACGRTGSRAWTLTATSSRRLGDMVSLTLSLSPFRTRLTVLYTQSSRPGRGRRRCSASSTRRPLSRSASAPALRLRRSRRCSSTKRRPRSSPRRLSTSPRLSPACSVRCPPRSTC